MNLYLTLKALHLISVISWMAGLLYLPRIFVYHSEVVDNEGQKETFKKLPNEFLLKMREGFWWGFVAVSKKMKIRFHEVKIQHFKRLKGDAGYKLHQMPGIIYRNIIGLLIIKLSNF